MAAKHKKLPVNMSEIIEGERQETIRRLHATLNIAYEKSMEIADCNPMGNWLIVQGLVESHNATNATIDELLMFVTKTKDCEMDRIISVIKLAEAAIADAVTVFATIDDMLETFKEELGPRFLGTSSCFFPKEN